MDLGGRAQRAKILNSTSSYLISLFEMRPISYICDIRDMSATPHDEGEEDDAPLRLLAVASTLPVSSLRPHRVLVVVVHSRVLAFRIGGEEL